MKERPAALSLGNLSASPDLLAAEMPLIPRHAVWYLPGYRDASFPPAECRLNEAKACECLLSSCRLLSVFISFFLKGEVVRLATSLLSSFSPYVPPHFSLSF